jgi:hypothetical protein
MALSLVMESDEEEYHTPSPGSMEAQGVDADASTDGDSVMEPPVHPVVSMQGAFEESIVESTDDDVAKQSADSNAEARRRKLLDAKQYDDAWRTRWKQRPDAQHHPLMKLMAQIVFGMHLLQQQQAKSNEEVVKILQTHVNEVDSFLEQTSEDFDLAIADIEERIRHLKLPMQHLDVFNSMLDDRSFRTQLLDGNDKIEKIIDRTAKAMNAALMDIQQGLHAAQELGKYLDSVKRKWPRDSKDILDVYGAMRGNEQGWRNYLKDLQVKGNTLGNVLVELGTVIGEMSRLAAAASRRNRPSSRTISPSRSAKSMPTTPGLRSKFAHDAPSLPDPPKLNKPLPREPDAVSGAARAAMPKLHPVPFAQRYEQPRQSPQSPPPATRRTSRTPERTTKRRQSPQRPKTSNTPKEARTSRIGLAGDLAEFLKHGGPLRSNPPERRSPSRSKSPAADEVLTRSRTECSRERSNPAHHGPGAGTTPKPKTHGSAVIVNSSSRHNKPQERPTTRQSEASVQRATSMKSEPARKDSFIG